MARMIPSQGPVANSSPTAEATLYFAFKKQLPDDFTVIHSLPWLAGAVREMIGKPAPTGETDFLILHPSLGILAIEVKGGTLRYEDGSFVFPNGTVIDPIQQVRKGVFALDHHLAYHGERIGIGYALSFPQSSMQGRLIPPALCDLTMGKPENICIDRPSLQNLHQRIREIMLYWQKALWAPKPGQIQRIINILCPVEDYTLHWQERIQEDNQRWLLLTPEQRGILQMLSTKHRAVLTGRSGTGKTLLAMIRARQMAEAGGTVLFLVYNVHLAEFVRSALVDAPQIHVKHFHQWCREAGRRLGYGEGSQDQQWYKEIALQWLKEVFSLQKHSQYSALVLDETQIFAETWLSEIARFFKDKPILACCDDLQAFPYEAKTPARTIADIIGTDDPFVLTVNMRSPRAVFDRLALVQPTSYQQISLRPEETDTLEEIPSLHMLPRLKQTLQQLRQDGIPREAILLIYMRDDPALDTSIQELVGKTVSVYRCRGIEAPVVIFWVNGYVTDIELACAYSRATTRCIAIYNQTTFLFDPTTSNPTTSQSVLLHHVQRDQPALQQWVHDVWPPTKRLELTTAHHYGREVAWSARWNQWVLFASEDSVADALWIGYFAFCTPYAISLISQEEMSFNIKMYGNASTLVQAAVGQTIRFQWCEQCQWWGRFQIQRDRSLLCLDCQARRRPHFDELFQLPGEREENHLPPDLNYPQQDSLFLRLLQQWLALSSEQRDAIRYYLASSVWGWGDSPINTLARITVGLTVAERTPGELVSTQEVQHLSWERYPWLHTRIDSATWSKQITIQVGVLYNTKKRLERLQKGLYKVMPFDQKENAKPATLFSSPDQQ